MAKQKTKMSKILKLLILSDLFLYFGIGLTSSILSVFITKNLQSTIAMAGLAAMLFLMIKSLSQIIFAKIFNPRDRYNLVLFGTMVIALTPFVYAFSTNIWWMLLAQTIYGIGGGIVAPAWMSLFIKNINKKRPGFEWSVYSTSVGMTMGIAAYLGAWLVDLWGFRTVFLISGAFAILGMLILLKLANEKMK